MLRFYFVSLHPETLKHSRSDEKARYEKRVEYYYKDKI